MKDKLLQKPIIFIGSGRSGTTIISEIILKHPDLAFPSSYHTKLPSFSLINLARLFFDNRFWRSFGQKRQLNKVSIFNKIIFKSDEAYPMWEHLTLPEIDFSRGFLLDTKVTDVSKKKIRNYFANMVRLQGKKRLAFKITGPSRISYLLQIFPDAQFVYLKRDKVPVISSFLKVDFWKNKGYNKLWWTGAYTKEELEWAKNHMNDPVSLTAFQINKLEKITYQEITLHKPKVMEINYEDFVKEPKASIEAMLDFLQLSSKSADCYKYLEKLTIFNQNKPYEGYFSKEELDRIKPFLN